LGARPGTLRQQLTVTSDQRGIFVTGTGTGVGKSVVAATICAGLSAAGERVAAFKPAVSGLDEPTTGWPSDHELLALAASAGQTAEEIAPYLFEPAVSPHLAAQGEGITIDPDQLLRAADAAAQSADVVVVEGVGGFLVPLTPSYLVRDLAVALNLPVVIASAPGLGTINHTLLTIEAVRASRLTLAGVVMSPWPAAPDRLERSNRVTIERLGRTTVATLADTSPSDLVTAAHELPIDEWLRARN